MYKKLVAGELSLGETFWKFGILGGLLGLFVVRVFGSILAPQLHGYSIYVFFTRFYNFFHNGTDILLSTVCYLTSLAIFCAYIFSIVLGVWRSSAEYDKNAFIKYAARGLIILFAYICITKVF